MAEVPVYIINFSNDLTMTHMGHKRQKDLAGARCLSHQATCICLAYLLPGILSSTFANALHDLISGLPFCAILDFFVCDFRLWICLPFFMLSKCCLWCKLRSCSVWCAHTPAACHDLLREHPLPLKLFLKLSRISVVSVCADPFPRYILLCVSRGFLCHNVHITLHRPQL